MSIGSRKAKLTLPLSPPSTDLLSTSLTKLELSDKQKLERLQTFNSKKESVQDLREEDFVNFGELGTGDESVVQRILHKPTGFIMARKKIPLDVSSRLRTQIIDDLTILHECNSPFLVGIYGAFYCNEQISVCMEYMDGKSLDNILTGFGKFPEWALGKITVSVLMGLSYLKNAHNLAHGNLKPANTLVDSRGQVKLCDFIVSKQLTCSVPKLYGRVKSYKSPESIQGDEDAWAGDIWSLGVTILELAIGVFPIPPLHSALTIFELLTFIVDQPAPRLPTDQFSSDMGHFVNGCLEKDRRQRLDLHTLHLHAWIQRWERESFDLGRWVLMRMGKYTPYKEFI